ncbi:MAG: hypothetical protein NTY88_10425 [Bacteroidetes bacterium]|nr:hypothetical protein [Bacteroidota bacterium]
MKNILEKARIAALVISLIGGAFKLLHWPGANITLVVGLGSLSLCHLLRIFFVEALNRKQKLIHYFSNLGIACLVMGVLFTLMHWPSSRFMVTAGIIGWALSYAVEFFMPAENNKQ